MLNSDTPLRQTKGLILIITTTFLFLTAGTLIIAGFPRMDDFEFYSILCIMFLSFTGFLIGLRLLIKGGFFDENI